MPRRPRRWPTTTTLAALSLTLGLLTTVAVSWSLAAWLPHTKMWSSWSCANPSTHDVVSGMTTWECGRTGMLRRAWRVEHWGASYGALGEATGRNAPETYEPVPGPLWGDAIPADPYHPSGRGYGHEDARGWPMLALWCEFEDVYITWNRLEWRVSGGVLLNRPPSFNILSLRALPLRPLWPGVLINTSVYTAAWAALLLTIAHLRRTRRRARNRCPACAYDLSGLLAASPCPECGAPVYSGSPHSTELPMRSLPAAAVAASLVAAPAPAQPCDPAFTETLGSGHISGEVSALTVFDDDADGPRPPALFALGAFTTAGGLPASRLIKWDGAAWRTVESLPPGGSPVRALAVFDDDGPGPRPAALYVGGDYLNLSGVPGFRILRWDGQTWSRLGTGIGTFSAASVRALAVHDEGDGPALFAGGEFTTASGITVSNIARWDGTNWSDVGGGVTGRIDALASFDPDGPGPTTPRLIAAGAISAAGAAPVVNIAQWDGSAWSPLAAGLGNTNGNVRALAVYGGDLYAAGNFGASGSTPMPGVARWNGSAWSGLGSGITGAFDAVRALTVFDPDADGPDDPLLFVGGTFTAAGGQPAQRVASWNGSAWRAEGNPDGVLSVVNAFAVYDPDGPEGPSAPGLVGGGFGVAQSRGPGQRWRPLPADSPWTVGALAAFDPDGPGPGPTKLFAGSAQGADPQPVLTAFDGVQWQAVPGSDTGSGINAIHALAVHDDDGPGPRPESLFVGGSFHLNPTGTPLNNIARWDGANWHFMGIGANLPVHTLLVRDDDGPGPTLPALYAGGLFTTAGGANASRVARWNGQFWTALGSGLSFANSSLNAGCNVLLDFDPDGPGPTPPLLIAAGAFDAAGGNPAVAVAAWDGAQWSAMGPPEDWQGIASPQAHAAAIFDPDGPGPDLPTLFIAGNVPGGLARWTGANWAPVPGAPVSVRALAVFDPDGPGPLADQLFAAGTPFTNGQITTPGLARWDGQTWTSLGGELSLVSPGGSSPSASTIAVLPEPWMGRDEPALYIGGRFHAVGAISAGGLARWGNATPWITRQPGPAHAASGGAVRFIVHATGPDLAFQWRHGGQSLTDGAGISGSASPILTISPARLAHAGDYDVVVTTACGDATSITAALTVTCPADWSGDTQVNSTDISAFLTSWLDSTQHGDLVADFNGDTTVNSTDISAFLTAWLEAISGGC